MPVKMSYEIKSPVAENPVEVSERVIDLIGGLITGQAYLRTERMVRMRASSLALAICRKFGGDAVIVRAELRKLGIL